jgi:hypothetical protein
VLKEDDGGKISDEEGGDETAWTEEGGWTGIDMATRDDELTGFDTELDRSRQGTALDQSGLGLEQESYRDDRGRGKDSVLSATMSRMTEMTGESEEEEEDYTGREDYEETGTNTLELPSMRNEQPELYSVMEEGESRQSHEDDATMASQSELGSPLK